MWVLLSYWCVFFSSFLPRINNHGGGLEEKLEHVFLKAGVHTVAQNWFVLEVKHKSYRKTQNYIFAISIGYWTSVKSTKMDGYWSNSFLCVYGRRRSWDPWTCKKRTSLVSSHLNRTALVNKGFSIWKKKTVSCSTLALEEGSFRICGENVD